MTVNVDNIESLVKAEIVATLNLMNMFKAGLWVILLLALSACQESAVPDNNSKTEKPIHSSDFVILALGDSLTEGLGVAESHNYPAILQQQLWDNGHQNIKVVNAGLSGETSTGLLNRLNWVMQLQPDLTILTIRVKSSSCA